MKQDLLGALARFDRAVREHPRHVRALVDASRAFGAMYNYPRAEALLDQLVELGHGDGPILHLAAQSYRIVRRPDQAIACFHQALAGRRATSESHLELGLLYERRNQLTEALFHAEARLSAFPLDAEAMFLKARVERRQGAHDASRQRLLAVVESRDVHWMTRARAHAELAALYDSQGDFAAAWEAMLASKRQIAPHAQEARAHRDKLVPPLSKLAQEVTAQHFARWRAESAEDGPRLALLTGLPRSGTTLLERILDAHPDVVAGDEFDAFPKVIYPALLGKHLPREISPEVLDGLAESFLAPLRSQFSTAMAAAIGRPLGGALLLDKNPSLLPLLTPYLRFAPHARVVVLLRDPRDVLVSCLMAFLPLNDFSVDFLSLETAADRLAADLTTWLQLRERTGGASTEVWYEDLVTDLSSTSRKVVEHLRLTWRDDVERYREIGAGRPVFSPSYDAVDAPVTPRALGRWRNYEAQLSGVLPSMSALLERLR